MAIALQMTAISLANAEVFLKIGSTDVTQDQNEILADATAMVRAGKIESARDKIGAFIHDNKNSPHPDIILAQLLMEAGRGKEAKQLLTRVTSEHPNRLDVLFAFSQIAINEGRWFDAYCIATHGNEAETSQYWDTRYTNIKRNELRLITALCCEKRRAWREARRIYESTGDFDQEQRLLGLGRVSFHLGDIPAAINAFDEAKTINANSTSTSLRLAQLYLQHDDRPNTEKYFLAAISEDENKDRWTTQLAYVRWLIWCNRADDAQDVLDSVEPVDANRHEIEYLSALTARMGSRLKKAQRLLAKLHQDKPTDLETGNHYALVLIESEDEALRVRANQIAEMNARNHPDVSMAWATLGWVQFRLGETKRAEESLLRSMKSGEVTPDSAYYLSEIKERLGLPAQAQQLASVSRDTKGPRFHRDETNDEIRDEPSEKEVDESDAAKQDVDFLFRDDE